MLCACMTHATPSEQCAEAADEQVTDVIDAANTMLLQNAFQMTGGKMVPVKDKAPTETEGPHKGHDINLDSSGDHLLSMESRLQWDPELVNRSCMFEYMAEEQLTLDQVCSDDASNNIKSDKGNYIQFTRREDHLMYNAWYGAFHDCTMGQKYVRDIVAGFAARTSCFDPANETLMLDDDSMYIPIKELIDDKSVVTDARDKVICMGDKHTSSQTELDEQLALLRDLVAEWDNSGDTQAREPICREMLAAHTLKKYGFVGVLHTTRPAACNTTAAFHDESLCQASEQYLRDFQSRDLFVHAGEGFKGRAAPGENERSERCKDEQLQGKEWNEMLTSNPGITVEVPDCSVHPPVEVFPEPVLKVGVWHEDQANNIIADAYRQCGAPLVAGISATLPQYLASTAAGPTKQGLKFEEALDMKEVLTVMSMLELGGFHATTGLTLGVNFYFRKLVVTPPFDSGSFDGQEDGGIIRCHDHETHCCTNTTKVDGFYNHQVYSKMIEDWESIVHELWYPSAPPATSSLSA